LALADRHYLPQPAVRPRRHGTPTVWEFTFVKEAMDGTNPKFIVRGEDGVKWKLKLGAEAKPETVASRLLWAAGYFASEDYFLADVQVKNMPAHLHRGQKWVEQDGTMHDVRLKRYLAGEKKLGTWEWRNNPFTGAREFNGLRVMIAVINNWDLKDVKQRHLPGKESRTGLRSNFAPPLTNRLDLS
jgi:hypothetical protein